MNPAVFPYFAGPYFSHFYFPPLEALSPSTASRDRDVFRALQAALGATGAFDAVLMHQYDTPANMSPDRNPVVVLRRTDWLETNLADPTTIQRTVAFEIVIALRDDDPEARFEAIERLESLVLNALDGQNWAGLCLRDQTAIRRGSDDPTASHPEARVILKGQFAYILEGYASRNTNP
jgi:hypothetical protein